MLLKMPRVVSDQRATYDSNELFRRLSRDTEIKYTGYRDRGTEERQLRFQNSCRAGRAEIAFVGSGTNFTLQFYPWSVEGGQGITPPKDYVNFDREPGKVHLKAPFILNGVCVCWKGWMDLHRLEGMGSIVYDEERAQLEATRQGGSMQQHMHKTSNPKTQNHKHPATGGSSGQIDKRPRLH
ncbi:core-binding factor, b subunit [Ciona intestinalis]|uniref:Core-binding factor subunit beta n=1 Tax=Ciona intestinalis TaxID=7719 RepID=Q4H3S2_CIOIN|nr:core-binding factor, b subunit [Ciona intestinalis]NP_001087205.1 core-binding factor, b subunit [Ciona intestinalis]XP_026690215.1 core-binding factor, b subunit isoform X1 [Ciona intestinalis]BAE06354.1 core-binding factor, b subunit [Ciona intestinalis]BAE06355.1 core-binding factor, b subunit [Ciona intestinalis]|eukprot:NP_001071672.1 core-binding factor, b subunit [Ciona intestinalis]